MNAGILGCGHYVPEKILTNHDLLIMGLETSDEWISDRTGIKERRVLDEGMASSDMAVEAAKMAIASANLTPHDIDLVIVATTTPDYQAFPSTACLIQDRLGLRKVGAFDIAAACTGFNYALTTAAQFVNTGQARYVLVVGVDCLSKYVNWEDRSTCILFGDGAGAVVVGKVLQGYGLLAADLYADGSEADILKIEAGGSKKRVGKDVAERSIAMNGKAVFKVAVSTIVPAIIHTLNKVDLTPGDIDYFIPHQANLRIINHAKDKLGLADEKVATNIQKYGNTSAASIPLALSESLCEGKISDGSLVVLAGFGAGFTWGVNVIRWGGIVS